MRRTLAATVLAVSATLAPCSPSMADTAPVHLHAAGSLKSAMTDIADAFAEASGTKVERAFGPSGLLRERIEGGEKAEVFASANMAHPRRLAEAGKAAPVVLFARNRLCALVQPDVETDSDGLLATMLREDIRVGTSTPKADPSGDYAFQAFDKAEAVTAGATETLKAKALQLTGGKDSEPAPEGRNPYGWVMESGKADIFLTYCTNALLARQEVEALRIVHLPSALAVGADYGLTVMDGASGDAWKLALYILSPAGQEILADYGFDAPGKLD
ncbi:molybdate ABC transporter substrate-binding protein [Stappia indica]|uniref:Molybdenum ABC transporter, molybdate-binding protein n=1 Tax=Stappia indica TaxID=538381 RepID=A0A285RQX9_9HYPH|nr:molybdate ABC transporter substrate-binding protein [Stappia indica]SOB96450.1 molybdenum ABC transporter, molybdate-binding protein [Stappia indica]